MYLLIDTQTDGPTDPQTHTQEQCNNPLAGFNEIIQNKLYLTSVVWGNKHRTALLTDNCQWMGEIL